MDDRPAEHRIIGGLRPPSGVTPNFVDPYSLRGYFILTFVMCVTITTIFISMRLYTKIIIIKAHEWEDYTSYVAWLGLIGYFGFGFVAFRYGAGVHQWNVPAEHVMLLGQAVNAKEAFYAPLIFVTKLSILLQYLRIFVPHRPSSITFKGVGARWYLIHALIWLNLLYYIINFFVGLFACNPRRKIWIPSTTGHCLNTAASITAAAGINVLSDVTILMLPLWCVAKLQMPWGRKIAVSAVFAAGVFACVASIMRLVFSIKLIHAKDLTYAVVPLALWSDAEVATGILCGCLPITPKFLRHCIPAVRARFTSIYNHFHSSGKLVGSGISRSGSGFKNGWPGKAAAGAGNESEEAVKLAWEGEEIDGVAMRREFSRPGALLLEERARGAQGDGKAEAAAG